ncbi:MAG: hypothetical protein EZS28_047087, partial [Streblomastix strix]
LYTTRHVYEVFWYDPQACYIKGGHGISIGWVFIILLIIAVALYFAIGSFIRGIIMKKKGNEVLPNFQFWIAVPGYIAYGAKLIFCPCISPRPGYDEIKDEQKV